MGLRIKHIFCICLLLPFIGTLPAAAQFVTDEDEPGAQKWEKIETGHFKIIYPQGKDSLARTYGKKLEKYYFKVGGSIGRTPNLAFKKKVPTVLRTNMASANGSVIWTPHRMQLWTNPDLEEANTDLWDNNLAVHESRHLSQMQFAQMHNFKPFRYILGEIGPSVFIALYADQSFLEGDAVTAETSLLPGGRGRSADFLNYYHCAFSKGDRRSWWKWRYGSQNKYTPDYYALGYITVAGMRTLYNEPLFSAKVFDRVEEKGLPFLNFPKTIKDVSGKSFKRSFSEICSALENEWDSLDRSRAPFQEMTPLTKTDRLYSSYSSQYAGETLFAKRKGKEIATELVRIDPSGEKTIVSAFATSSSRLRAGDAQRPLWWSEENGDARWGFRSWSDIKYMDSRGHVVRLTRKHRYYNPVPCLEQSLVCAASIDSCGRTSLVLLDSGDGSVKKEWKAPDGMQITEGAMIGTEVYAVIKSSGGIGIYRLSDRFEPVLGPIRSSINELFTSDGKLFFGSDRTGVNELYSLDVRTAEVIQITITPLGGSGWTFSPEGDLVFSANTADGAIPFRTAASDLPTRKVDAQEHFEPNFARTISRQEEVLGIEEGEVEFSEPKRYNKFLNLFRLHSWTPFFVDYNAVSSLSMESLFSKVKLGATAFFQNDLGNFSSVLGLKVASEENWIPSFHGNFIYSGLYPVIEATFDIGKTQSGTIKTYIPWRWNRGGWLAGFIPQLSFSASSADMRMGEMRYPNTRLVAGARGYIMRPLSESSIFPRWGVGAEVGFAAYPTSGNNLRSNAYQYVYMYLPGILRSHGTKFTAMVAELAGEGRYCIPYASILPRGISSSAALSFISAYPTKARFTLDYSFPFAPVDWDIFCPVAYIRNFEFNLHSDLTCFWLGKSSGNIASSGAQLCVVLGNLLWLPYRTKIGISYDYNYGRSFDSLNADFEKRKVATMERHKVGAVFTVDF